MVSSVYPKAKGLTEKVHDGPMSIDKVLEWTKWLVGDDCWGLYLTLGDRPIQPVLNTYPHPPDHTPDDEVRARNAVIKNPQQLLDRLKQPGDRITILLGGNSAFRKAIISKTDTGFYWWDFQQPGADDSPPFLKV